MKREPEYIREHYAGTQWGSYWPMLELARRQRVFALAAAVACAVAIFASGCGVPDSGVQPVKPIGSDAAHVIPAETKAYNAGLSALYESLAVGVESGELKTVRDAAEKAVKEDQRLRGEYKSAMGAMMESRLGDEELPADAPAFFREMSTAFGRLAK